MLLSVSVSFRDSNRFGEVEKNLVSLVVFGSLVLGNGLAKNDVFLIDLPLLVGDLVQLMSA